MAIASMTGMAPRPTDVWRAEVEQERADLAAGKPREVWATTLWADTLIDDTDDALDTFEDDLDDLLAESGDSLADNDILDAVRCLVLDLNDINDQHRRADLIGYETGEREALIEYIEATLSEAGIDVTALAARHGFEPGDLAGGWRSW
jgi:hypothetical protein